MRIIEKYTEIFRALSDRTRLRIFLLLIKTKKALCICEIMDALNLPQSNISKHLRELKIAGLVKDQRDGKFVLYSVVFEKDNFTRNLIKTISSIPDDLLKDDLKRIEKRLSLRVDGKIVVGMSG